MIIVYNHNFKYEILSHTELLNRVDLHKDIQGILVNKKSNIAFPNSSQLLVYIQKDANDRMHCLVEGMIIPPVALVFTIISFDGKLLSNYKNFLKAFGVTDVYIYNSKYRDTDKALKFFKFQKYSEYGDMVVWYRRFLNV